MKAPIVAQTAGDLKLSFPVLLDPNSDLMERFGMGAVPMTMFISRNFKVHREFAFVFEPVEKFLEAKGEIIELAKQGRVPQKPTEDGVKELPPDVPLTFWWPKGVAFTDREKRAVRHAQNALFPRAGEQAIDEMLAQVEQGARAG